MSDAADDSLIKVPDLPIRLPVFEGPLDLLLYLIRRNEVDIYDIPISEVTAQYMTILRKMEQLNLEVAGEFFVMASTLMYIKSRMLLPRNEQKDEETSDDEDDLDPRWELVQQLIEYRKFKEAASSLETMINQAQTFTPRDFADDKDQPEERPLKYSDRIEVWNMFNQVLRRLSERMVVGEIHDEQITVADCMERIIHTLKTRQRFQFTELFDEQVTITQLVSTFIAMLELTRLRKLSLEQNVPFGDIDCIRVDEEDAPDPSGQPNLFE